MARILKRPMFNMGGRTYQAQGTGITSGLDTPKRGLVDGPGGYAGDEERLEEIKTERINVVEPRVSDAGKIFRSFGEYANPYNEDGDALTIGQVGKKQVDRITAERDEQYALEQAAKMENLTIEEQRLIEKIKAEQKLKGDLEITKAGIRPLDVDAKKALVTEATSKLEQAKKTRNYLEYTDVSDKLYQPVKRENKIRVVKISKSGVKVGGF